MGAKIDRTAAIHFGTILKAGELEMGPHSSLGPFAVIRANSVRIGAHAAVRPLTLCQASEIQIGSYARIAPTTVISSEPTKNSIFSLGDHSRIFPFCWIEPGEGVRIGSQTAIGGHSLIFTHGTWPDYLNGGMITRGPVTIGDNVWIPWRVTVLPNVTIGQNAVVSSGSVVNKSIPENAFVAGVPAKIVAVASRVLSTDDKVVRARRILQDFADQVIAGSGTNLRVNDNRLQFDHVISIDEAHNLGNGDLLFAVNQQLDRSEIDSLVNTGISVVNHRDLTAYLASKNVYIERFIGFLRRYGIRLYIVEASRRSRQG